MLVWIGKEYNPETTTMPKPQNTLSLEEVVIAVYSALDDALRLFLYKIGLDNGVHLKQCYRRCVSQLYSPREPI